MLTFSRPNTSEFGSKSIPTPATNTSIKSDNESSKHTIGRAILTSGTHAYRCRGCDLRQLAFDRRNAVCPELTKAMSDRMSSAPMPAPRIRPSQRKKTTTAKTTHRTLIVMRALRASFVMGMYIMSAAMMEKIWRGQAVGARSGRD